MGEFACGVLSNDIVAVKRILHDPNQKIHQTWTKTFLMIFSKRIMHRPNQDIHKTEMMTIW